MKRIAILLLICLLPAGFISGQAVMEGISYDESKVPAFEVPDLLTTQSGKKITSVTEWENIRRPEILEWFSSEVYGRTPQDNIAVTYETLSENKACLNGKATTKQVKFRFTNGVKMVEALLLMVIPNRTDGKKSPVFVGYNFKGNHTTLPDTDIEYSPVFSLVKKPDHPDWQRGVQANRWCYDKIIDRGYAVATMFYQDIFPDQEGLRDHSVVSLFPGYDASKPLSPDEWQAIGAWAWGSSRIVDYLEAEERERLDMDKIAIMGHSRQGKAALWTGAQDHRFRVVISNDSGCGGAAMSKRVYGENVARITKVFPFWFCPAFNRYADNEAAMHLDQHALLALVAPNKLYVASAENDLWADPKGEFLGAYYTGPVYNLYGLTGLKTDVMPAIHQPLMEDVGYHIRTGDHDVTDYDWERFMDFTDKHFK